MAHCRPALVVCLSILTGCLPAELSGPPVIDISAAEYAFGAPDTIPAGRVVFRLSNLGQVNHVAAMIPLADGESIRDLMGRGKVLELRGARELLGGPVTSVEDRASEVLVTLAPGRYAIFCYLRGPDGQSHAGKGMVREIVAAGEGESAAADSGDRVIRLGDFGFSGPGRFASGAGSLTIRNEGRQPHEVFLSRIADGFTVAQALAWSDTLPGPSPWESYGGTAAIGPGGTIVLRGEFPPGSYILECFLTDPATGESHVDLGMTREIVFTSGS